LFGKHGLRRFAAAFVFPCRSKTKAAAKRRSPKVRSR